MRVTVLAVRREIPVPELPWFERVLVVAGDELAYLLGPLPIEHAHFSVGIPERQAFLVGGKTENLEWLRLNESRFALLFIVDEFQDMLVPDHETAYGQLSIGPQGDRRLGLGRGIKDFGIPGLDVAFLHVLETSAPFFVESSKQSHKARAAGKELR